MSHLQPLRTLIVGLGRSGAGLHLPVLRGLRDAGSREVPLSDEPIVVLDPAGPDPPPSGTLPVTTLDQAADLLDPARTVVHLCTPPAVRAGVLNMLGRRGFSRILVEKPLAVDGRSLAEIEDLIGRWDLELRVVAPWLASTLTDRLLEVVRDRAMGALRSLSILQAKPRFTRSRAGCGHPSAFDVEVPHAVGVALTLAGQGQISDAALADMQVDDVVVPGMGRAWLSIEHDSGVQTEILSDLTAPTRERRITLGFDRGRLTGHYASSADDHTAQLVSVAAGRRKREIFPDDALTAFVAEAYGRFAQSPGGPTHPTVNAEVVRILCGAKRLCRRRGSARILSTLCHMAQPGGHSDTRARGPAPA